MVDAASRPMSEARASPSRAWPCPSGSQLEHDFGEDEECGEFDDRPDEDGEGDEWAGGEDDGGNADDGFRISGGDFEDHRGGVGVTKSEYSSDSEGEDEQSDEEERDGCDDESDLTELSVFEARLSGKDAGYDGNEAPHFEFADHVFVRAVHEPWPA